MTIAGMERLLLFFMAILMFGMMILLYQYGHTMERNIYTYHSVIHSFGDLDKPKEKRQYSADEYMPHGEPNEYINSQNPIDQKLDNRYLMDYSTAIKTSGRNVVPNIVHFIYFGVKTNKNLTFINYISILSAYKIQKPDLIMFHCDLTPAGLWWNRLWNQIPITVVNKKPPRKIFGQKIQHVYHSGDIAKLQILRKYGGIYIDFDVILINNLDHFLQYPMSMAKPLTYRKFNAGVIIASKDSPFLKMWYDSYRDNYKPHHWDYNCGNQSYAIYLKHPELVHIEYMGITDYKHINQLQHAPIEWRNIYLAHIMMHVLTKKEIHRFNPKSIKFLKSNIGQIMKYIYWEVPMPNRTHHKQTPEDEDMDESEDDIFEFENVTKIDDFQIYQSNNDSSY